MINVTTHSGDLIAKPEELARLLLGVLDLDWFRTLGPNDQWMCEAGEAGDACEEHEKHCRPLYQATLNGVDYKLAWDPTWGQLLVMEVGFQCWFGNVEKAVPSEREMIAGLTALQDTLRDAWQNLVSDTDAELSAQGAA